jgi:hypothetical protein
VQPDIVLIAGDEALARAGLAVGAPIVGVAIEVHGDGGAFTVPTVAIVGRLTQSLRDGDLVLVDGTNGFVLSDPSGKVLAAYQACHAQLAPRRRVFLDACHLPARTLDGRLVRVSGLVSTLEECADAVANGADALVAPADSAIAAALASTGSEPAAAELAEVAHGKPVSLALCERSAAPDTLVRLGQRVSLTVLVSDDGGGQLCSLECDLDAASVALLAQDEVPLPVGLGLWVDPCATRPAAFDRASRLAVWHAHGVAHGRGACDAVLLAACAYVIPAEAVSRCWSESDLLEAVRARYAGIVAPPDAIQWAKAQVANLAADG